MIGKLCGHVFLGIQGWKPEGDIPPYDKYVLVAAPHTSNWDLPYTLYTSYVLRVRLKWLGKKEIFRFGPWGWWMKYLGGIPVDRSKSSGLVEQAAQILRDADKLALVVPPEGTRKGGSGYWKSGFYRIAEAANVPIVMGYVDYGRKRVGFGPSVLPSGDVVADMEQFRAFYKPEMAKFPDRFRVPRLRDEEQPQPEVGVGGA